MVTSQVELDRLMELLDEQAYAASSLEELRDLLSDCDAFELKRLATLILERKRKGTTQVSLRPTPVAGL